MPDTNDRPNHPVAPGGEDSKALPTDLYEEDKFLLAAFREDMRAEQEMLNRLFGDEMYPLNKETLTPP